MKAIHATFLSLLILAGCSGKTTTDPIDDSSLDTEVVEDTIFEDTPGEPVEDSSLDVPVDSPSDSPDGVRTDRVLFVGNSYTASNQLHLLVSDLLVEAGHEGLTRAVTPGGYRLDQHAADADGSNGDTTLRNLLVTGPEAETGWDAIVLQQQSQVAGFPRTEPVWISMLSGATILRDLGHDAGADTVIFMTWGYRDGDDLNDWLYPDYSTMQTELTSGYNDLADRLTDDTHTIWMAPAGEAYRSIHDAGVPADFEALYSPDGSHPSIFGSYLTACVIFATLTGTSPVGFTAGPDAIDADGRLRLQQTAEDLVFGVDAPDLWTR